MSELEYNARDLARAFSDFLSSYRYLENEVKELKATLEDRDNYISDLEAKLKSMEDKLGENEDLVTQLETLRKENEAYSQKIESLEKKVKEYETTIRDLLSVKQENERLEARLEEMESEYNTLKNELELEKKANEALQDNFTRLQNKYNERMALQDDLKREMTEKYTQRGIPPESITKVLNGVDSVLSGNTEEGVREVLDTLAESVTTVLIYQEKFGLPGDLLFFEVGEKAKDYIRVDGQYDLLVNDHSVGKIGSEDDFNKIVKALEEEGVRVFTRRITKKGETIAFRFMSIDYFLGKLLKENEKLRKSIENLAAGL